MHALESGLKSIIVRSNDTVVVILVGYFYTFLQMCADVKLWIAFGINKLCKVSAIGVKKIASGYAIHFLFFMPLHGVTQHPHISPRKS